MKIEIILDLIEILSLILSQFSWDLMIFIRDDMEEVILYYILANFRNLSVNIQPLKSS